MDLTVAHVPAGALFLHQVLVDSGLPHLVVHAASSDHWGVRHTRSNTVDTYALLSMLRRHRPRHLDDGPLGSRVEETGVPTKHWIETKPPVKSIFLFFPPYRLHCTLGLLTATDGRHVDDGSAPCSSHLGYGVPAHHHHACHIDAEVAVPSGQVNAGGIAHGASDSH